MEDIFGAVAVMRVEVMQLLNDAFKILEDDGPPECPRPTFGVNASGQRTAVQWFHDGGGIAVDSAHRYRAQVRHSVAGASGFLTKEIDPGGLRAAVRAVADMNQALVTASTVERSASTPRHSRTP